MSDRHEQARAEAERRVRDLFDRKIYGPANSAGYLVGHAEGVEWADANPQPSTITRDTFQGLIDYCNKFRDKRAASDDEHARLDAYAWGFVETAVGEYLWDLGIEVEDDDE